MPATLVEQPLGISCVFSDGTTARFCLDRLPCPRLVRDLLSGLVELVHPHGRVDAAGSVNQYVQAVRGMARTLSAGGFSGGAGQLRRAGLGEYWMGTSGPREACTRRMLAGYAAAGGQLAAGVAELVAGRAYNQQPFRRVLPPYSETEWGRLVAACRRIVDEGYAGHRQALAAAEGGVHPGTGGWSEQNLAWLLRRVGPVSTSDFSALLGRSDQTVRTHGGFYQASTRLFPHLDVVIAYRLLFGVYSGIVPDGIDELLVADLDWAGDASILLAYVKGRTGPESLTLPRPAVRLLEQWLSHSALLRGHTGPRTAAQLWLGLRRAGRASVFAGPVDRAVIGRWAARHGVTGDDRRPLKIHRSRIRTSHLLMRDRSSWVGLGRAVIDPNHSPRIEGDHYLTASTPAQRQAVETIIEDAQHDLTRRAHPPTVVTDEDAAALARDYPGLLAGLDLDDTAIAELIGGARDVFVAACADQLSGLHGPKGKPCPARPWVCLLCPLAVFAPRHAANLLRLKAFFSRQWQQMPAAQFMAVFGPYTTRIHQILDRFDPAALTQAAGHTGEAELPLRPEESS